MSSRGSHLRNKRIVAPLAVSILVFAGVFAIVGGSANASDGELSGWVLDSDGSVVPFGSAPDYGDSSGTGTAVSLIATADRSGYWVLWASGLVTAHGSASHFGDITTLQISLDRPAISLSLLPSESGYIILAADGGVFTFGSALFFGAVPGVSAEAARDTTAVAIQLTSAGYRIIHHDGGVFAFGNASFAGSIPGVLNGGTLDQPIVDAVADEEGLTYAMIAADGGVFAFGWSFSGSLGGTGRTDIVGASGDSQGGYTLVDIAGTVYWFSNGQLTEVTVPGISNAADLAIAGVDDGTTATTTTTTAPSASSTTTTTTTAPTTTTTSMPTTTTTTTPPPPGQVVIWDPHTESAGPGNYFQPLFNDQGNWVSPNVTSGDAILTLEIVNKPSSLPIDIQVCAWKWTNDKNFLEGSTETCSDEQLFTDEIGPIDINLGPPEDWWQSNGAFPWTDGPDVMRIILKDEVTATLLMATKCGDHCWAGVGPLAPHVPVTMTASLTFNN